MRVGRPIPAPPQPVCDYCGAKAILARVGEDAYPYLEDHGPVWICVSCQAWVGVRARSKHCTPLGHLANAALREERSRLYDALEPLVAAKIRRDGVNAFEARGKAMKWLIASLKFQVDSPSIHALSLEQCEQAIQFIAEFQTSRRRE